MIGLLKYSFNANYVSVILDSFYYPAVVLLTLRWRGFYRDNRTFHQLL